MNNIFLIVLRFFHVFCSALWVSVAIIFRFFVNPALKSIGPESSDFGKALNDRNKFSKFMGSITLLSLISGLSLFYKVSGGFNPIWIRTGSGIGFTIGAVSGIFAFLVGGFAMQRATIRLRVALKEESTSEKKPNPGLESKIAQLRRSLNIIELLDFILLSLAMATMATARYW